MKRVYFDTNVFSDLKSNRTELFQKLNEQIVEYRENISFFFSQGHIRDKRKDDSDRKYEDFEFMESLVLNNYLAYHPTKKRTSSYLATPREVFDDTPEDESVAEILNKFFEDDEIDTPELKALKGIFKTYLKTVRLPIDFSGMETLPEEQYQLMAMMLPLENKSMSLLDWINHFGSFSEIMFKDQETYKRLRKMVDEGLNNGKFTLTQEGLDFNEALKDSVLQKTFIDFIKDSLYHKDKDNIPYYDFYLQAYNSLDLLGISKDKINSKNSYSNLFNDSLHSYFARYCDYLVTSDDRLSKKSKALYQLFDVGTRVLSVKEFVELMPFIGSSTEQSILHFVEKISIDLREAERLNITETETGRHSILDSKNIYLNAFDEMLELIHEGQKFLFLLKRKEHLLSALNYREEGQVVSKALKIFGVDLHQRGSFDFDTEVAEIREKKWLGRLWNIGPIQLYLHHSDIVQQFTLVLGPLQ